MIFECCLIDFISLSLDRSVKGLGDCCRQLIKEVATIQSMDVVLPLKNGMELKLRVVARPDKQVQELIGHLGLELPTAPKMIQNVVSKNKN